MTPAARYAAAIEVLDAVLAGQSTEPALLNWTRRHRFAGSKDRAAIRDIVFSIDRRRASCAAMGGSMTGRGLVRGYLAQEGIAEDQVFGVDAYAPPVSKTDPPQTPWEALSQAEKADLQPWMWEHLQRDHGLQAAPIAEALRHRAPVWLRVNTLKSTPEAVLSSLKEGGFDPAQDPQLPTAIEVRAKPRQLAQSPVITKGWAEFQDLGPQRAVAGLTLSPQARVLDYCAGGGGKSLALAARGARVTAHDAAPARMKDLPLRAKRAGATIEIANVVTETDYDVVVCDVPCSGSGASRRAVDGKWRLTETELSDLVNLQRDIVGDALDHLRPGGMFVYMTCSLLAAENTEQSAWIGERCDVLSERLYTPLDGSDGFYVATFRKAG